MVTQLVSGKAGPGLPWLHLDQDPWSYGALSLPRTRVSSCVLITEHQEIWPCNGLRRSPYIL